MIHYREGYRYQLSRTEIIEAGIIPPEIIRHAFFILDTNGRLTMYQAYAWDGATWCPEWLVPPECSCPHDVLCQAMRHKLLDYDTYAPLVHGLLRDMVAKRRGKILAGIVHTFVVKARGGHPDNSDDNPELSDP